MSGLPQSGLLEPYSTTGAHYCNLRLFPCFNLWEALKQIYDISLRTI